MTEPTRMDAPNQEAVRPDGSGPAEEGEGGPHTAVKEGTGSAPPSPSTPEPLEERPRPAQQQAQQPRKK